MEQLNRESVALILETIEAANKAKVFQSNTQRPFGVQAVTLDLTTARLDTDPLRFSFPFKTLYIQAATDSSTTISVKPDTQDTYQSAIPLKINDVLSFEYPISSLSISWAAQSTKTMTLIFFVDAKFSSGSLNSSISGGVTITEGTAVTTTVTTLSAATAAAVAAASGTRKVSIIQNNSGADLFLGPAAVTDSGATIGFKLAPGDSFEWRNSAALYGYSVLGGPVLNFEET